MANRNVGKSQNIETETRRKAFNALARSLKSAEAAMVQIGDLNRNHPGSQVADMVDGYDTREYLKAARDQDTPEAVEAAALARMRQAHTATMRRLLEYAAIIGEAVGN